MIDEGPRIGLWGRFDVASFGDAALPGIYEREIRRRIPSARVEPYGPLGERRSGLLDGGFASVDLGEWSPRRSAELADALDCVVVVGDAIETPDESLATDSAVRASRFFIEGLGGDLERRCPMVWSAVGLPYELDRAGGGRVREAVSKRADVSVRDAISRERLARAGVAGETSVVPDPLFLLPRLFTAERRSRRLEYLRHMEWFPREAEPLVIQGGRSLAGSAEEITREVEDALAGTDVPLLLVEVDPERGDRDFLDAVATFLKRPAFRFPREATLADVVTVLANARAFVGTSDRGALAASSFGTPSRTLVPPAPGGRGRRTADSVAALSGTVRGLLRSGRDVLASAPIEKPLDAHFDRLAEIAESAFLRRLREGGDPVPRLVRRVRELERRTEDWSAAHAARTRQVIEERLRLAGLFDEREARAREGLASEASCLASELTSAAEQVSSLEARIAQGDEAEAASRLALDALRAERETLADELARQRTDHVRLEAGLERSREEIDGLRSALEAARREASEAEEDADRKLRRAEAALVDLRAEIERSTARLEKARSEQADVRVSQTLLFAELAEARSDASRFAETREGAVLRAERERDFALAESARLVAEIGRLTTELGSLRAAAGRTAMRGLRGGRGA
jgi:hypothetical protein